MKKYRILLLLFVVIILTGCQGNYNLKVNKDYTVNESFDVNLVNREGLYDRAISIFKEYNIDEKEYDISQTDDTLVIKYNNKYDSILDYLVNSKLYKQLFNDVNYDQNNDIIKIETSNNFKLDSTGGENIINDYNVSLLQITIETPLKLKNHNADDVYNNKYTWILDSDTSYKKIKFTMDNIAKYDKNRYSIVLISIGVIIVGLLGYAFYKYKKVKKI